MKAACWHAPRRVAIERVPDPELLNPRDAIVRVRATTAGGVDLHLYDGAIPSMRAGDILGHELVGDIVARGAELTTVELGARVAVSATIACGRCAQCVRQDFSLCDNANPNACAAERVLGYAPSALLGHSHLFGGYAGAFAEYVRVPFADVGCIPLPDDVSDEAGLFLGDALPTAFAALDHARIARGDVVAVWGCGAVGQLVLALARTTSASRLLAIDPDRARRELAAQQHGAHALDPTHPEHHDALEGLTGGRGVDVCIDAVGMEARGARLDRLSRWAHLTHDSGAVLAAMARASRKGGTLVIAGTYAGHVDRFPIGVVSQKALTLHAVLPSPPRYARRAIEHIQSGALDPSFVITARRALDDIADVLAHHDHGVRTVLRP